MQHKPAPSIVAKTNKPTQAQKQASLVQAAWDLERKFRAGLPNPSAPPYRPMATPTVIKTDKRGLVRSPSQTVAALTAGRKPKPATRVQVDIHPDGRISVAKHDDGGTGALPATQGTPTAAPAGSPALPAAKPARRPARRPATATPASVASPAATGSSDFALAQDRANQLISPIVKQITDALNQRVSGEQAAITGYSGELARLFGLYSGTAGKAYDTAIASDSTVNDALANRLGGVTTAASQDLSARLAAINADPATAARIAADVAAAGKGAGNAGFAVGSAGLSSLIGRKANAQEYGARLPGLAGLYGLQDTRAAQARGTQDLASSLASVQGNVPQLVSSLLSQIQSNRNQQQQLQFERDQFGVKTRAAKQSAAVAAADKAYQRQKDQAALQIRLRELGLSEARLKRQQAKDERDLRVKGALRGLTPQKYQEFQSKALAGARIAYRGTTDANGGQVPPISWQQYLTRGLANGIPMWILIEQGRRVYPQQAIRQGLIRAAK